MRNILSIMIALVILGVSGVGGTNSGSTSTLVVLANNDSDFDGGPMPPICPDGTPCVSG